MVRCTWDRPDVQAAEQTAHPTAVRAGGRVSAQSLPYQRLCYVCMKPSCLSNVAISQ